MNYSSDVRAPQLVGHSLLSVEIESSYSGRSKNKDFFLLDINYRFAIKERIDVFRLSKEQGVKNGEGQSFL